MSKIKIGDAQIHYHVHGAGEPLLLIAGMASDLYTWKKAVHRLEPHHKVIAFDNRGFGLTEAPETDFTTDTLADDAAGLLDALGIGKAHVAGWSMGGLVAQKLALRHPGKVGALVLMSTFMKEPDRSRFAMDVLIHAVREGASMETFMLMMQAWCSTNAAFEGKNPSWNKEAAADRRLPPEHVRQNAIEGIARQKQAIDGFDTRRHVKELSCPTLVVHGTDDIMVPPRLGEELAAHIPGAEFCLVKGAAHFLPVSGWTEPVLKFLAKHPLTRQPG